VLRLSLIFMWLLFVSVQPEPNVRPVFGVRVSIGSNSQINTYVCYLNNGRVLSQKKLFDEASFIKIVSGYWPSIYNPERKNYFEENNISCGVTKDEETQLEVGYCNPFDSLWKLRFSTYPFISRIEEGWSNKLHRPSLKQEKYLYDRYGVASVDANFFQDSSFWRIMRDVVDPDWIKNYKAMR
jgi:hypothetical protein